jgi:hypothetical protein
MFPFRGSQWDATLYSRCHDDGAALELPFAPTSQSGDRLFFVFTRIITYKLPDDSTAELEVIVASSRILRPASSDESRGWKILSLGLGLVLAIRLSVFPARGSKSHSARAGE